MVSQTNIPAIIHSLADDLEKAGFTAYLIGGCVRDLLTKRQPNDWDLTTNATPEQIQTIFPDSFCNNDYGTVGVKTEDPDPTLQVIEITPYRAEGTYSDARRPDSVVFGVSLEEDLARRDFTVNAIAIRVTDLQIIDPFNGLRDLREGRLRAVRDPGERFAEDALRMLRAVRLAAQLDFLIEPDTIAGICDQAAKLKQISRERIGSEFSKIIASDKPMYGIILLEKFGLLQYVVPELLPTIGCEQGGVHKYDVYEHLLRSLQAASDKNYSYTLKLAALFHDIGKPATRRTGGKNKHYTFFGHEVVGAKMTKEILASLRIPKEISDKVVTLVRWHMFFSDPDEITLAAVRRTIVRVGEENIDDLLKLRICDRIGTGRPKALPFRLRKYQAMVDEARRDPISVALLKIDGSKIMSVTNEKPGKKLGLLLNSLLEEVLSDPQKNTADYLEKRVQELVLLPDDELEELAAAGKKLLADEEAKALQAIARNHKVT